MSQCLSGAISPTLEMKWAFKNFSYLPYQMGLHFFKIKTYKNNCKKLRTLLKQTNRIKELHCRVWKKGVIKKTTSMIDMMINSGDHKHFHEIRF